MEPKAAHRPGFAYAFYVSQAWRKCRADYLRSVGFLCERCAKEGIIRPADDVHHRIRLTQENIRDPGVALNFANLEALCGECHRKEHRPKIRWRCDAAGHVEL